MQIEHDRASLSLAEAPPLPPPAKMLQSIGKDVRRPSDRALPSETRRNNKRTKNSRGGVFLALEWRVAVGPGEIVEGRCDWCYYYYW